MVFAKKYLGQHFLTEPSIAELMVEISDLKKDEVVLEIGPGEGILTKELLKKEVQVTCVEFDEDLIDGLKKTFGDSIQLFNQDILLFDERVLKQPYKIIANIPYNITSAILQKFLTSKNKPTLIILMVQDEVAKRICEKSPNMSVLSTMCQMYAKCTYVKKVKAGSFNPPPKVDSAILKLELFENVDVKKTELILRLVNIGFSSKRKMLAHNLLNDSFIKKHFTKESLQNLLIECSLKKTSRAQELSVNQWKILANRLVF